MPLSSELWFDSGHHMISAFDVVFEHQVEQVKFFFFNYNYVTAPERGIFEKFERLV